MIVFSGSVSRFAVTATTAVVIGGCTTDSRSSSPLTSAAPSSTRPSATLNPVLAYVQQVNTLCEETMASVRQIVPSGYSADFPVSQYRLDAPKLRNVYDTFDRKFAAIPVPAGAEPAAAAFTAYLLVSDQTKAAALAATGSQDSYRAEFNRQVIYWQNNPVMAARDTAGFSGTCNYR